MEAIEVTSSVNNSRHNSNATPNPVENNGVIKEENQINRNAGVRMERSISAGSVASVDIQNVEQEISEAIRNDIALQRNQNLTSVMNNPQSNAMIPSTIIGNSLTCLLSFGKDFQLFDSNSSLLIPPPAFSLSIASEHELNTFGREALQNYLNELKDAAFCYGQNHKHERKPSSHLRRFSTLTNNSSISGLAGSIQTIPVPSDEKLLQHCFETVPTIYFRANFSVAETPMLQNVLKTISPISSMFQLPDFLTQYLDVVEVNLLKQISLRSDSFYSALINIQALYVEVGKICSSISKVREFIQQIRSDLVLSNVDIIKSKRRITNLKSLIWKMELIRDVRNAIDTIAEHIQKKKYNESSDLLKWVNLTLATELKGLKCVNELARTTVKLSSQMNQFVCNDLMLIASPSIPSNSSLLNELKLCFSSPKLPLLSLEITHFEQFSQSQKLQSISLFPFTSDTLNSMVSLCSVASQETAPDFQHLSLILLNFEKSFQPFFSILRPQLQNIIKEVVRLSIVVSLETFDLKNNSVTAVNNSANQLTLAQRIERLSHFSFIQLLSMLFRSSLSFLLHLTYAKAHICSAFYDQKEKNEKKSLPSQVTEWNSFLTSISEFTHSRSAKIVDIKRSIYSRCTMSELEDLWDLCESFITQSEYILSLECLKENSSTFKLSIFSLRHSLVGIAREYLISLHEKLKAELTKTLEEEVWSVALIPQIYQQMLDSKYSIKTKPTNNLPRASETKVDDLNKVKWDDEDDVKQASKVKCFTLENNKYFVASSVLTLMDMFMSYMNCAKLFNGSVSSELISKICEILKYFNSRCCQLVLGAGAMQSAGLKSITAKHLALASQCLSFLISQMPVMKLSLNALVEKPALLNPLDSVTLDLENHKKEIHSKLVDILTDIVEKAVSKLFGNILAAVKTQIDALSQSAFELDTNIAKLLDSTRLLHKALSSLLSAEERDSIFLTICGKIETIFVTYMGKLEQSMIRLNSANNSDASGISKSTQRETQLVSQKIVSVNVIYLVQEMRKLEGLKESRLPICAVLEKYF